MGPEFLGSFLLEGSRSVSAYRYHPEATPKILGTFPWDGSRSVSETLRGLLFPPTFTSCPSSLRSGPSVAAETPTP